MAARWAIRRSLRRVCVGALVLFAAGAQTGSTQDVGRIGGALLQSPGAWQSVLYQEHPLVGRIWRAADGQFVASTDLTAALRDSRFLLLGEKHDNPDHHTLQSAMLGYLLDRELVAAVSFEMMDSGFQSRLAEPGRLRGLTLEQLKSALQWDDEGWDWTFYGPLISQSLQAGVGVLSANLTAAEMGRVYGEPLAPAIAEVLDEASVAQLNLEIDASHCNLLPASQFPAMVRVQQARDHQMASSLVAGQQPGRLSLLIAGNYHVRKDLGVPRYVLALRPETDPAEVLSVALLEVDPDSEDPRDYLQAYSAEQPFDYVWFTPAVSDEDYCASLVRE